MGSIISLGIGRFEIDWGKNSFFVNHSSLFLPGDIKPVPYYYADDRKEMRPGYARHLSSVVRRLELLGFTLSACRRYFTEATEGAPEGYPEPAISFDLFARALANVNVDKMRLPDEPEHYDLGEYVAQNILNDPEFTQTAPELESLTRDDGTFFENLHPYVILRLLAESPNNLEKDVCWRFADLVEGGWVQQNELYEPLSDQDRYLVVTEGSTDTAILKKTLPLLQPDVVDFFEFVDMSQNYPFTGTGNVVNFCRGLAKIRIQNRVIVVLDNDTAGRAAFDSIRQLNLPPNLRVMTLPAIDEMQECHTLGPTGDSVEDVNGRGVSIECFLDLRYGPKGTPSVRWTGYNSALDAYQGELVNKDGYVRASLKAIGQDQRYDLTKLYKLWSSILNVCVSDPTCQSPIGRVDDLPVP